MNAVIKMRVGVFDSGLGGLTVLEALIKKILKMNTFILETL